MMDIANILRSLADTCRAEIDRHPWQDDEVAPCWAWGPTGELAEIREEYEVLRRCERLLRRRELRERRAT